MVALHDPVCLMKLRDHIQIDASPSAVWQVISDPGLMELWNPKCVRCFVDEGPFGVGFTYEASFKLGNNPEQKSDCLIEEYVPNERLTTKYSGGTFERGGYVKETYHLIPRGQGTRVKQILDFSRSEIPFIFRLIMKLINSVGYSVGKGPLDGIKELAEQEDDTGV